MLFQLHQQLEDSKPGSRNWEGDDTYLNEDEEEEIFDPASTEPLFPKVEIVWKHPKDSYTVDDRNIVLFGVRGVGSSYIHANFSDSVIIGAATIPNVTTHKETSLAMERDTLAGVAPSESACLICHNARLSCWVVCCQVHITPEYARFLANAIVDVFSEGRKKTVEMHVFDSFVASLYRSPSRERVEPPMMRVVASGVPIPEGCCGLESPNIVEGVGAALVNCAHFSEGVCKAVVYVTIVETAYVEARALMEFDRVVAKLFDKVEIKFASESEINRILRKNTWSSPRFLFA